MSKFIVSTRKNGEFQFVLQASNGQVVMVSEGYTTKAACMDGIQSVKKNAVDSARFELLTAKNGQYYFNLKASNGQVIGTSEMYKSEEACKGGVESVMKNAPDAVVEDTTL